MARVSSRSSADTNRVPTACTIVARRVTSIAGPDGEAVPAPA
jgi:hypothetical protein